MRAPAREKFHKQKGRGKAPPVPSLAKFAALDVRETCRVVGYMEGTANRLGAWGTSFRLTEGAVRIALLNDYRAKRVFAGDVKRDVRVCFCHGITS